MARIKGSSLVARFRYLRTRFPEAWDDFVAELSPTTRALAIGPCLKGSWYPFSAFVELNVSADRKFGKGDLALAREMGRDAAHTNLPVLYKLFYKVGSPEYIFSKIAGVVRQILDSGDAEVIWDGPTEARLELRNFAMPNAALCRSIEGYLVGSLEVMGMTEVTMTEINCRLEGAALCEYLARWKIR